MTPLSSPIRPLPILGSVLTGVIAAATVYWTQAELGLARFAPLAQLWTLWALSGASVGFGLQQWTARQLVDGSSPIEVLRRAALVAIGPGLLVSALAIVLVDDWFEGHLAFVPLAGAVVAGAGLAGHARGVAAARDSMSLFVTVTIGENLIRLLVLVALVLTDAGLTWYGVGLVAGFAIVPLAWGGSDSSTEAMQASRPWLAAMIGAIGYATVFGAPLLLGAAKAADETVSAVFLVFSIARVPFVVAMGVLPFLTVWSESLLLKGDGRTLVPVALRSARLAGAVAVVVAAVAWVVAEPTFGELLGTNETVGREVWALVGAASVLAVTAQALTIVGLAFRDRRGLLAIWMFPVAVGLVAAVTSAVTSAVHVAIGVAVIELVLVVALVLHIRQSVAPPGH